MDHEAVALELTGVAAEQRLSPEGLFKVYAQNVIWVPYLQEKIAEAKRGGGEVPFPFMLGPKGGDEFFPWASPAGGDDFFPWVLRPFENGGEALPWPWALIGKGDGDFFPHGKSRAKRERSPKARRLRK